MMRIRYAALSGHESYHVGAPRRIVNMKVFSNEIGIHGISKSWKTTAWPRVLQKRYNGRLSTPTLWTLSYCGSSCVLDPLFQEKTMSHTSRIESSRARTHVVAISPAAKPGILQRVARYVRHVLQEFWDFVMLTFRGGEIIARLSPMVLLTPAAMVAHQYPLPGHENKTIPDLAWWYFTSSMDALGPCFVKLCQWVATRRDMFPPNVCDRLAHLHDQGKQHSWRHTHDTLTKSFGDYEAKGLHIDSVIGCGSAAQVYRGSLSMDGKEKAVAVKVLHPRMAELVERDLWLMDTVAKFLHSIPLDMIRMANLPRAAANFGTILRKQTDLSEEATNLIDFRRNFYGAENNERAERKSLILFPSPIAGWVGVDAMVEDLVEDAVPISKFLADDSEEGLMIRKELGSTLLRAFLKMIFLDNHVHGDLHPGNCLVVSEAVSENGFLDSLWNVARSAFNTDPGANRQDSEEEEEVTRTMRKIVFLDAGISTSLSSEDQRNLRDLFRAVILNEGYEAGRLMVERAKYERCSQTPGGVEAFANGIEGIVSEFHDNRKSGLSLGAVRIGALLGRVLDLCRVHGVEIDPSMASIVVSTLVLEGLGRSLDPNLNLIDFAVPFVLGGGRV